MRLKFLLFVLPLLMAACLRAGAQTCTGSLGDPVFTEDFGSSTSQIGQQLGDATTYPFSTNPCPPDGSYTIEKSIGDCFGGSWHQLATDHTGNPNGCMMVVNASADHGVFYTQKVPPGSLCPGTTYEFTAYILNLTINTTCGGAPIQPNITFEVDDDAANVITPSISTGNIPPYGVGEKDQWIQYGIYFTTPADGKNIVVKMINNSTGPCGNDVALDDIAFRACGPVIQAGVSGIAGVPNTLPLCQGDPSKYRLTAQVTGGGYKYTQWQVLGKDNVWVDVRNIGANVDFLDVSLSTGPDPGAVPGTYQYRFGASNNPDLSAVQCRVYSTPVVFTVYPNPVVQGLSPTTPVCDGDALQLSVSGGVTYKWTGPNNFTSTQNPLTITNVTPADAGTYTVTAYSQYSCQATASTVVTVNPKVTAAVSNSNITICEGDTVNAQSNMITASGGTSYAWTPANSVSDSTLAAPLFFPTDTTVYTVKVTNQYGCIDTAKATINVLKKAVADAGPSKVIFEGQSTQLSGSQKYGNIFYWTPTTALSDPNSLTPTASPVNDITYTLHVNSTTNCGIDSSTVFVRVYKKITIPTMFSPNNDGVNDLWNIEALVTYPGSVLAVYNRYGQQVFRSVGYSKPWNGRYKGQPVPEGTYYYVLDLKNDTPKISGWVVVVR